MPLARELRRRVALEAREEQRAVIDREGGGLLAAAALDPADARRQVGAESQTGVPPVIEEVFTVKVGVADQLDGTPNKGHVDVQLAGVSTELQVRASAGAENAARLKFVEVDGEGEPGAQETSYALELSQGALDLRGGHWSMLALEDARAPIDPSGPATEAEEALLR